MIDFLVISTRSTKRGVIEIYPKFLIKKSEDLMIRGGDFYAIWVEERGLWSTDEQDALQIIDQELDRYAEENRQRFEANVKVLHMWDAESGMIDSWHKYCQKQLRDSFHMLDEKIIFSNTETNKKDYASKRLNYPLEPGDLSAYDKLVSTLYSDEERQKIEWAIGSIVSGESKKLQKFMVFYGEPKSGKSTILNIINKMFDGYCTAFDARAIGSSSNSFALEAFKTNPLVAIQHDGDLSRIEDNTRLNSLVSHELMTVNEKFKSTYTSRFKCFLFIGTNKPVKITDAKSGLIRRLIDVSPSGNKIPLKEYNKLKEQVSFELGAIAYHCQEVYLNDPGKYDDYVPVAMLGASNDFYNYIIDSYHVFKKENGTTLTAAWEMYKTYCDDAKVLYPLSKRTFKEELKNYFSDFDERFTFDDGTRVRSYYYNFRTDKFKASSKNKNSAPEQVILQFNSTESIFDKVCADCPAQYANDKDKPTQKWVEVSTKLSDIDTSKVHYVKVPENHIVIDFDIPDKNGMKSFSKNLEAASKFPPTYGELSKSGAAIHLHYIYAGDPKTLSRVYADHIEIKVFTGKSSLRRKLTKCNDLPIATISSGLPTKGEKKVIDSKVVKSEKKLRELIAKNLRKEVHPGTKPSVDFIFKILEDAYSSDLEYDVTDMRADVLNFAANSTHNAPYCIKLVNKMMFKSVDKEKAVMDDNEDTVGELEESKNDNIIFFDCEVFPNLLLVCWKHAGKNEPVVPMYNPSPSEIEELSHFKLIGYNCRRYDNHILYARLLGYNNKQIFNLSQKIVNAKKGANRDCFFREAYNFSYTDIYDFSSDKMSLKKLEIKMGIHHQELGMKWDEAVPENMWEKVAEYCTNDVLATEEAFNYLEADFVARQILADLAGMSVNNTTNSLTTKIIFGNDKNPQEEFRYRDLAVPYGDMDEDTYAFLSEACPEMVSHTHGEAGSMLPYFPGYVYDHGKSTYRGEEVGEGGYVYSEPNVYENVALLDISSMHPHSMIAEILFGIRYTKVLRELVEARVDVKHEDWEKVEKSLNGKLAPYIQKVKDGEITSKRLAGALKIAINSIYGLTAASFDNAFRDSRNIDNIVAKRGALFMIDLKHAVQEKGFTVAHIKTDSIKIPNATPEIIQFVMDFGKDYGYTFEHEATYEKLCLVNDAVYVAKENGKWTATGTQFQIPYVFKTLFSKEKITFDDLCETKEVKSELYLDMNEDLSDVSSYEKELSKAESNYRKGLLSDTSFEKIANDLRPKIEEGHNYIFIGKVGQFCPIKQGYGGGTLVRSQNDKYYAVTGTTGYRWLESEMVRNQQKIDAIDRSYYDRLVDDAVEAISEYCDFEWFTADESDNYISEPWIPPCGDKKYASCFDCPKFNDDKFHMDCELGYDISEIVMNKPVEANE